MPNLEEQLAQMRVRIRQEVNDTFKELGELVSELSMDYAALKPVIASNPSLLNDLIADVLVEDARIPKFIPRFAVKWLIGKVLARFIKA